MEHFSPFEREIVHKRRKEILLHFSTMRDIALIY